ncbi:hypothetical protein GCM10009720_01130 [Yaniella flava]|uniref:Uncharacterized protein n=1 Tax=Yaniella flava TaxID=287930 RepID=A0ABN2TZU7_9MICC|nr:hypothetical protein [Micrococcaceae bacterium]
MTSQDHPTPEDSQPAADSSASFAPPPPLPSVPGDTDIEDENDDDFEGVGLATEMVFSGQQREALRSGSAYEHLDTGELSSDDAETNYDDVQHTTQLIIGEEPVAARPIPPIQQQPQPTSYSQQSYAPAQTQPPAAHRSAENAAQQHYSQATGSSNEPFAITMMIVLGIVALGVFGVLGLLIYRVLAGG